MFHVEEQQLGIGKPCRKDSGLLLIPDVGLVVNKQLVVSVTTQTNSYFDPMSYLLFYILHSTF